MRVGENRRTRKDVSPVWKTMAALREPIGLHRLMWERTAGFLHSVPPLPSPSLCLALSPLVSSFCSI